MGIFKLFVSYWMSCGFVFLEEVVHFIQVFKFMWVELFVVFPYYPSKVCNI